MKKLNIGNSKQMDKINIWNSLFIIFDKLFVGINPPDETTVNAKLNASKSLISTIVKKNK